MAERARSMCGSDAWRPPRPAPSGQRSAVDCASLRTDACPIASLFLRAAFPVQLGRRGVALDPDVAHGLRPELDRSTCQDPRPAADPGPRAARDPAHVSAPPLRT